MLATGLCGFPKVGDPFEESMQQGTKHSVDNVGAG